MTSEIVAFVHAKGSSQRVPGKNMRRLGDKPLFCHAIQNALCSQRVTRVVIDSENDEILAMGQQWGAEPLKRPEAMATNLTTGDELAAWQAGQYPSAEIVIQVVPTSPFIRPETIDAGIRLLEECRVDSVVGVFSEPLYVWEAGRPAYFLEDGSIPNSSAMQPVMYETTGLYINHTRFVLEHRRRLNLHSCTALRLSRLEAIDINTEEDFIFAEVVWKGLHV